MLDDKKNYKIELTLIAVASKTAHVSSTTEKIRFTDLTMQDYAAYREILIAMKIKHFTILKLKVFLLVKVLETSRLFLIHFVCRSDYPDL